MYCASNPSQESRQPWHKGLTVGPLVISGSLVVLELPLSTLNMQAVNVINATMTSHGCDAQNSPWARNSRPVFTMFLIFLLNLLKTNQELVSRTLESCLIHEITSLDNQQRRQKWKICVNLTSTNSHSKSLDSGGNDSIINFTRVEFCLNNEQKSFTKIFYVWFAWVGIVNWSIETAWGQRSTEKKAIIFLAQLVSNQTCEANLVAGRELFNLLPSLRICTLSELAHSKREHLAMQDSRNHFHPC